jgi:hypothetical protein
MTEIGERRPRDTVLKSLDWIEQRHRWDQLLPLTVRQVLIIA